MQLYLLLALASALADGKYLFQIRPNVLVPCSTNLKWNFLSSVCSTTIV